MKNALKNWNFKFIFLKLSPCKKIFLRNYEKLSKIKVFHKNFIKKSNFCCFFFNKKAYNFNMMKNLFRKSITIIFLRKNWTNSPNRIEIQIRTSYISPTPNTRLRPDILFRANIFNGNDAYRSMNIHIY